MRKDRVNDRPVFFNACHLSSNSFDIFLVGGIPSDPDGSLDMLNE
jgi:hypothetical protein